MSYQDKYLKYKNKYLELKTIIQSGGANPLGLGANPLGQGPPPIVLPEIERPPLFGNPAPGAAVAGSRWNPGVPPPAKVGDHIQETTGEYLGNVVKIVNDSLILNTGLNVPVAHANWYYFPINLPDGVKIIDERPKPDNLENGPWPRVEYNPMEPYGNFPRGFYVVGKNGEYWGRAYTVNNNAFHLIDGTPGRGRIAKMRTVYGNPDSVNFSWFKLRFPAGVRLEDSRRPAAEYGPEAVALPGPIPLPPGPLPIKVSECGVCFGDKNYNLVGDDPLRIVVLPCGHTFHKGCVNPWIAARHECPTCRAPARMASNLMLGGGVY